MQGGERAIKGIVDSMKKKKLLYILEKNVLNKT